MLDPQALEVPEAQIGFTDMTLPLIRYEIISYFVRLRSQSYAAANGQTADPPSFHQVDEAMDECRNKVEERYLKFCDPSKPFHWFVTIVARMMIARVWANVHHPLQLGKMGDQPSEGIRDRTFIVSLEILESWLVIVVDQKIRQWNFAFQNYSPWQSLAFVLLDLCTRSRSKLTDRGWTTATKAFDEWTETIADRTHDLVWNRMRRLLEMAQRSRPAIAAESDLKNDKAPEVPGIAAIEADIGAKRCQEENQMPTCTTTQCLAPDAGSFAQTSSIHQPISSDVDLSVAFHSNPLPFIRWAAELDAQMEQNDNIAHHLALFDEGNNWW